MFKIIIRTIWCLLLAGWVFLLYCCTQMLTGAMPIGGAMFVIIGAIGLLVLGAPAYWIWKNNKP